MDFHDYVNFLFELFLNRPFSYFTASSIRPLGAGPWSLHSIGVNLVFFPNDEVLHEEKQVNLISPSMLFVMT